ncbi:MAG TPA: hypothetical protein VGB85_30985 [Nannocystis sp.]|jgi:hypothetical protein
MIDYLNITTRGVASEILVNGAPILRTPIDAPCAAIPSITEWLIAGDNRITAAVYALSADEPPQLRVQLCAGRLGEFVTPGEELARGELALHLDPDAPPTLPAAIDLHESRVGGPRWAWQDAARWTLDEDELAELWLYIELLHGYLQDGHIDDLVAHMRIKYAELGPLYGAAPDAAAAVLRQHFVELSAGGAWRVAPLVRADLLLRPVCDARLVTPVDRDGEPALRGLGSSGPWELPVFVGRVAGGLEILR